MLDEIESPNYLIIMRCELLPNFIFVHPKPPVQPYGLTVLIFCWIVSSLYNKPIFSHQEQLYELLVPKPLQPSYDHRTSLACCFSYPSSPDIYLNFQLKSRQQFWYKPFPTASPAKANPLSSHIWINFSHSSLVRTLYKMKDFSPSRSFRFMFCVTIIHWLGLSSYLEEVRLILCAVKKVEGSLFRYRRKHWLLLLLLGTSLAARPCLHQVLHFRESLMLIMWVERTY